MTPTRHAQPDRQRKAYIPASFTLARWRLRQTWRLLFVTGLGIVLAVVLLCAAPLLSEVALTAGVRATLTASPQDTEIELQANTSDLSNQIVAQENSLLSNFMQTQLRTYLSSYTQFVLQTPGFDLTTDNPTEQGDKMFLTGVSMTQASPHLHLLQGQLPLSSGPEVQILITERTARDLHATVGTTFHLRFSFFIKGNPAYPASQYIVLQLPLHVAGIISLDSSDFFWHSQDFEPVRDGASSNYRAIMSSDAFLGVLTQLIHSYGGTMLQFDAFPAMLWYFFLNASHVNISNLDNLINHLNSAQVHLEQQALTLTYLRNPQLVSPTMHTFGSPGTLERFRDRIGAVQIPIALLTIQMLALLLFFVSIASGMYVDRQSSTIALLRSRGASRRQVFSAFIIQTVGLGLLALLAAPVLAMLLVHLLGSLLLAPADQNALNILTDDPLQTILGLRWYALIAVVGAAATMILAIWSAAQKDVLAIERDLARPRGQPVWQRLRLDRAAILIALAGYGISWYLTHSGALDARTNLLLYLPVSLVGPIFLLLAAMLLFLRCFPLLLHWLAHRMARRRGATSMLALAHLSRSPQHALRTMLLLAFSISFAIFTLVFSNSEAQQINSIAAQQVGSDFGGVLLLPVGSQPPASDIENAYSALTGVTSVTAGYTTGGVAYENGQATAFEVRAVDVNTYAQTAIWTGENSSQPLDGLLPLLTTPPKNSAGESLLVVPALVDAVAWNALGLHPNARFVVNLSASVIITFQAVAEVQHIPTINDSLETGGGSGYITPGGVLVDLDLYAHVYEQEDAIENANAPNHLPITINYVWVRTRGNPYALATVRSALTNGPLELRELADRRAMLARMQRDPLYLALRGVLILGTCATALLALIGSVLASWVNAKRRMATFTMLRALGSTSRQLAAILSWEQGIVYAAALALGIIFGALLTLTAVPVLVFTNPTTPATSISSTEFYVVQHVLPVQVTPPPSLWFGLIALVVIFAGATLLMARIVSAPGIGQTLRYIED